MCGVSDEERAPKEENKGAEDCLRLKELAGGDRKVKRTQAALRAMERADHAFLRAAGPLFKHLKEKQMAKRAGRPKISIFSKHKANISSKTAVNEQDRT
ncbi:hypothetical protein DL771_004913 [Monosporascus sp. 5C6A]|nr:hypothetical protein DL771_004913 [Monosporascus sp. 5C6A]